MTSTRRKLLLVELNEITWDLIDPLIDEGKLPAFQILKRGGCWGAPVSVDLSPQLDPWVTWTTLHTGQTQDNHGVYFLQQPPETIAAPRLWEICHEQGFSVGVYGSLCSWPPQPVDSFYVPDTFAQDAATYPVSLEPIQLLNLTYTRSVRLPSDSDGLLFKTRLASSLPSLGLRIPTAVRIGTQLLREMVNRDSRWRRVALQPLVNFDFFQKLYRRHRPDFATFHSNHVAHYQHTYWRAMQPDRFPQPSSPRERSNYGRAIEHGYRTADRLLNRMLSLVDSDTVLVVASSMGQKPFVAEDESGKDISQLRSLDELLRLIGATGRARALATMSDQFNIYPHSPDDSPAMLDALKRAYIDTPDQPIFFAYAVDNAITVNMRPYLTISESSQCHFPASGNSIPFESLVYRTGHTKSGCHDPRGMMILYGPGILPGSQLDHCNNLDIAPTLLTLMGARVPAAMKGRVLWEAFSGRRAVAAAR
jgi:hypothetical protein